MKSIAALSIVLTLSAGALLAEPASTPAGNVMPAPAQARWTGGRLAFDPSFTAVVQGADDGRVRGALDRMRRLWELRTGLTLARSEAAYAAPAAGVKPTLVIECQALAPVVPKVGEDETYTLDVTADQAVLRAPTTTGALRGLATLTQMLQADATGWMLPTAEIKDAPRFAWRGLLMDPCRHWLPVEVIKRNIDGMALAKLNVLHFHLTEDQGFRIESKAFPKLHELGSDGLYYTQEQIRDIVAYAAARGIRVMPEFDVPGHATTWVVAYPEFASAPGPYQINRRPGVHDPVLDPTNEELYPMLQKFFAEMATLFPDEYIHIGGDENNGKHWKANAKIQEFIRANNLKDNPGLHAYFNRKLQVIVSGLGKKMMGWNEILHPNLPAGTVVHYWMGATGLVDATRMGFGAVLSRGFYLDHQLPAATMYANDPVPANTKLTPEQQARVLGGEACMWAEWVTEETVDSRIWPRAAVVAERLWSPREVNDVPDMYRRLALMNARLDEQGLRHEMNRDMMLRRFGDGVSMADARRVREAADLFEAGTLGVRFKQNPTVTQATPLTGFADCTRADSAAGRRFAADVEAVLFGDAATTRAALTEALGGWRQLGQDLAAGRIAPASPRVRELATLGEQLDAVAAIGLEAVAALDKGAAAGWSEAQLAALVKLGDPRLGVTLPIVKPVRLLVAAAGQAAARPTLPAADWRRQVEKAATPPAPKK